MPEVIKPVRIGVELEFLGPSPRYLATLMKSRYGFENASAGSVDRTHNWTFGIDSSACDGYRGPLEAYESVEFRTPILDPDSATDLAAFEKAVSILEPIGVPTKTCGMHVHISTLENRAIDWDGLSQVLSDRFSRFAFQARRGYCRPGAVWHSKGSVVSIQTDRHVEIRVFNSTLEWEKIARRVKAVVDAFRSHLSEIDEFTVECTDCHTRFQGGYNTSIRGRERNCPHCGRRITVASTAVLVPSVLPAVTTPEEEGEEMEVLTAEETAALTAGQCGCADCVRSRNDAAARDAAARGR